MPLTIFEHAVPLLVDHNLASAFPFRVVSSKNRIVELSNGSGQHNYMGIHKSGINLVATMGIVYHLRYDISGEYIGAGRHGEIQVRHDRP